MNAIIAMVKINEINVDPEYQRVIDSGRIKAIGAAFAGGAVKAVSLSRRADGSLWCYDGQHTIEVLRSIGANSVAAVIVCGSQKQEAEWFELMNGGGVRKATQREKHKAGVVAGNGSAILAQELLDRYGLEMAKGGSRSGTTSAIGSIKIWLRQDPERLVKATDMINRLWSKEDNAWSQIVIRGAFDVAGTEKMSAIEKGMRKNKITPRRILDTAAGMQAATGTTGGGAGYAKKAFFTLAKVKE